ncbi:MAG: serine/threonine protein kinase, partial [Kiritimatiellia bacterium]
MHSDSSSDPPSPARHRQAKEVFDLVIELIEPERSRALHKACDGDQELALLVQGLIAFDLGESVGDVVGDLHSDMLSAVGHAAASFVSAPERPIQAGEIIGNYRALYRLGIGGMAEVWAVQHRQIGTKHALKVMLRASAPMADRMIREGLTQARLNHPNLLPVRDVLDLNGVPALLMPLVHGPTLGALLKRHKPTRSDAISLFRDIVEGVAHAHRSGLVHRDIKPHNVLLHVRGDRLIPRISDFGLVRDLNQTSHTVSGLSMGTPTYAAPEQLLDGRSADTRADVFSLGVLWVELLTGELPFTANSLHEMRLAHLADPDLHGLSGLHRALAQQMLASRPDDRPHDAAAVLQLLDFPRHETSVELIAAASQMISPHTNDPATRSPDKMLEHRVQRHNVPVNHERFIGRDDDVHQLCERLASGGRASPGRLFTLVGTGGCGKTRMAAEVARAADGEWTAVWWINLQYARDLQGIYASVARDLGVKLTQDPAVNICHALKVRGR